MSDWRTWRTDWRQVMRRIWTFCWSRLRRCPLTLTYSAILICTGVASWFIDHRIHKAQNFVSTDVRNLERHPVVSLLGSALFNDGNSIFMFVVLIVSMCTLELWLGWLRALGDFLVGHIGATLLTYCVITFGLTRGWYNIGVLWAPDFGISYGVICMLATLVARPPTAQGKWFMFAGAVGFWLLQAPFDIPHNFTAVGHTFALLIGLSIAGLILLRRRQIGPTEAPTQPARDTWAK